MKLRTSFVSNSSSSSFIYHCNTKCNDFGELKKKLIKEFAEKFSTQAWQKRLSPQNLAESIVSGIIDSAEDSYEEDQDMLKQAKECCKESMSDKKCFCCKKCGEDLNELIAISNTKERRFDFSLTCGGTEPPYSFEDFIAQELLENRKNDKVLTVDEIGYDGRL